jgi:enoyl-CoA hydratase
MPDDILVGRAGRLGTITLNRPAAINALTTSMVRKIAATLDRWEHDETVATVLLEGAGDRGLCAGGDIVMFRASAIADDGAAREFWIEEYELDARLARYPKPVVVFMDGIVMGGGVGLSGHAAHRVATERLVWAMPEVRIGFSPDVGGPFLLARAPGELGLHLALTGERIGVGDAITCGFADSYVPAARLAPLREALQEQDPGEAIAAAAERAGQELESPLAASRDVLDRCYRAESVAAIVARLEADDRPAAQVAAAAIRVGSPTAQEIALRAVRRARNLGTLEEALARDLEVSTAFLGLPDFAEGIRAAVIDKDRTPRWSPARPEEVERDVVERIFAAAAGGPG